ncbi:MAG: ribonuclease III [Patescibacteria group bacterium]
MVTVKLEAFEKKLGVTFKNKDILKEALTHRSYLNERPEWPYPHNERLEYLGDAVLELAVTENLFHRFPSEPEGKLTVLRAALVNYQTLNTVALEMGLDKFVLMSRGESKDTGKARDVIYANAIEAVIGAIYIDQGFKTASTVIKKFIVSHLDDILETKSYRDPKSELQEIVQEKLRVTPSYGVLEESGPAHKRTFIVGVYFDKKLIEKGSGLSKQEAEVEAARRALLKYKSSI